MTFPALTMFTKDMFFLSHHDQMYNCANEQLQFCTATLCYSSQTQVHQYCIAPAVTFSSKVL